MSEFHYAEQISKAAEEKNNTLKKYHETHQGRIDQLTQLKKNKIDIIQRRCDEGYEYGERGLRSFAGYYHPSHIDGLTKDEHIEIFNKIQTLIPESTLLTRKEERMAKAKKAITEYLTKWFDDKIKQVELEQLTEKLQNPGKGGRRRTLSRKTISKRCKKVKLSRRRRNRT